MTSNTPATTKANNIEPGLLQTSKTLATTKVNNVEPG